MFDFFKKEQLKKKYDQKLLNDIHEAKDEWDNTRNNEGMLSNITNENILVNEQLARAKYEFLFREAKHRKVKAKIQESVIVR